MYTTLTVTFALLFIVLLGGGVALSKIGFSDETGSIFKLFVRFIGAVLVVASFVFTVPFFYDSATSNTQSAMITVATIDGGVEPSLIYSEVKTAKGNKFRMLVPNYTLAVGKKYSVTYFGTTRILLSAKEVKS